MQLFLAFYPDWEEKAEICVGHLAVSHESANQDHWKHRKKIWTLEDNLKGIPPATITPGFLLKQKASTWEAEVGGFILQGHPQLYSQVWGQSGLHWDRKDRNFICWCLSYWLPEDLAEVISSDWYEGLLNWDVISKHQLGREKRESWYKNSYCLYTYIKQNTQKAQSGSAIKILINL